MKKGLVVLVMIALLAMSASASLAQDDRVVVTFWHGQAGVLGELLEERIAEFNASQSEIEVQAEFIGDFGALHQRIIASAAGDSLPTMAQVGNVSFTDGYLQDGLLTPIQTFVDGDPDAAAMIEDFYPGFVDENIYSVDGESLLVSFPFGKAVTVLYYNTEMLAAAGIDSPPATWEEFADVAATITESEAARAGFGWTPSVRVLFGSMVYSNGGALVADDWSSVRFNEQPAVDALTLLADMVNNNTMYVTQAFDWQNDLVAESISMGIETIVSRPYIEQGLEGRFTLGLAQLPSGNAGFATTLFGPNAVIFASAPEAEQAAAWEFLKWWVQPENTVAWSLGSGYVPVSQAVVESDVMKAAVEDAPYLQIGLDSLPNARALPNRAAWNEIDPILTDAINQVLLLGADPQEALDAAADAANAILARQ